MKKIFAIVVTMGSLGFLSGADAADVIKVDGSSTVFPITEAVAEEFGKASGGQSDGRISGTGGGFKRFCRGETTSATPQGRLRKRDHFVQRKQCRIY